MLMVKTTEVKNGPSSRFGFLSVTSVVAVVVFSLAGIFSAETVSAASSFDGGAGTVGDPYQISTCVQLQDMQSYLASYFVLTVDFDCNATSGWNACAGFVPVGTSYFVPFAGGFNGANFTIDGLYINLPATDNVGLFGYVMSSTSRYIQNLKLSDVTIVGREGTGPLAGMLRNITV